MVESASLTFIFFWSTIPFLVLGLMGNVLVMRIVHKTRDMHTPTHFLLANMALSDVIIILLWPFYFFIVGTLICKFVALLELCIVASSITLTVLAVERYHAMLRPLRTGLRLTEDNITKTIFFIWIASIIICFPEFFLKEWSDLYDSCVGPWTMHTSQATKVYVIVNTTVTFILLALTFYCYGSLIKGLYFSNTICPETVEERSAEKRKLLITFLVATVGFCIGYVPTLMFYSLVASSQDGDQMDDRLFLVVSSVVDLVFACSLCFNPVLYAFRSTNFKEGFKCYISCRDQATNPEINEDLANRRNHERH